MVSLLFYNLQLPHTVISNSEKLTHPNIHMYILSYTVRKEIKCVRDFEKLHEIVRDTKRISSCFSDFRIVSRTIQCSILKFPLHFISSLTVYPQLQAPLALQRYHFRYFLVRISDGHCCLIFIALYRFLSTTEISKDGR